LINPVGVLGKPGRGISNAVTGILRIGRFL
jgi:hypothetical protein